MLNKAQIKILSGNHKYIWKVISYVFIALLIGLNIWLVILMNTQPVQVNNDLWANFQVIKNAFSSNLDTISIVTSQVGIAFYTVSSVAIALAIGYGIALYQLYHTKAMWTYFLIIVFMLFSYVGSFILTNADSINLYAWSQINQPTNVDYWNLNIFYSAKLVNGSLSCQHLGSAWIYIGSEIAGMILVLPFGLVYVKSRKAQLVQQNV